MRTFNQIENWKCHMFNFRLIPLDRTTHYGMALLPRDFQLTAPGTSSRRSPRTYQLMNVKFVFLPIVAIIKWATFFPIKSDVVLNTIPSNINLAIYAWNLEVFTWIEGSDLFFKFYLFIYLFIYLFYYRQLANMKSKFCEVPECVEGALGVTQIKWSYASALIKTSKKGQFLAIGRRRLLGVDFWLFRHKGYQFGTPISI